jgi:D-alanyl-D-alanine dipeptidase
MDKPLVEITPPEYDVLIDIRYATENNFTGKPVYGRGACFLHPEAAECLAKAIRLAEVIGYRIKIFDAYRPTEAQWKLWEHTPDPDFLADPNRGSPHSRGVAIDLTLTSPEGMELDMGTAFDAFCPESHHGNLEVSPEAQRNRHLLMGIMTTAGWDFYRNEWWHYQLFNSRNYPLLSDEESGAKLMKQSSAIGEQVSKILNIFR